MIHIDDLKEKINKELTSFKKEANAIACSVLDKDGFIIYYEKDNSLDEEPFKKKMIKLFTTLETLKMINFYEKTEYISFGANLDDIDEDIKLYSNGFKILIKAINENLILITVFKLMENINEVIPKFDAVVKKLSNYLYS